MMKQYSFPAIVPTQSEQLPVFCFCAPASVILEFARIDRASRGEKGILTGFQRPQVASHIKEIRKYIAQTNAILPNSIVIAFTSGVSIERNTDGSASVTIEAGDEPCGFVVDGQQRLTALSGSENKRFELVVSAVFCKDTEELRKQFILINNTKPLPKSLIYELLPSVNGLPDRLSSRAMASALVERLNYDESSSLFGQIKQHTNPSGIIQDTVVQRLIMASLSDGALRDLHRSENGSEVCFNLLSSFFAAVQNVYSDAWNGHKPRTSRLVHGAGIMAMGYVMEYVHSISGAIEQDDFTTSLEKLKPVCAWTEGTWEFDIDNRRPWNSLQFIPRDYMELSQFLLHHLKSV